MINNYQNELLTILIEESGELIQEICKIKRFGLHEESHHIQGKTHLQCLQQEIGDILATIDLLYNSDIGLTESELFEAAEAKKAKLKQWMKFKKPLESDSEAGPKVSSKVTPNPPKRKKK